MLLSFSCSLINFYKIVYSSWRKKANSAQAYHKAGMKRKVAFKLWTIMENYFYYFLLF